MDPIIYCFAILSYILLMSAVSFVAFKFALCAIIDRKELTNGNSNAPRRVQKF